MKFPVLLHKQYLKCITILITLCIWQGCRKEAHQDPHGQFQIPAAGYLVSVEASGSEDVDELVRQLVSQRPAPYPSGYSDSPTAVVVANRYSTPEVEAALKRLKEMGPEIFPSLVKHLGDDRYSYSGVVAAWLNFRVGDAIVNILSDGYYMHSGYKFRNAPSGFNEGYFSFGDYLHDRGAEAWAEWAKSKMRLDIQLDFIDWCIEKENERGYVDEAQRKQVLDNYEAAREGVKKDYFAPN